DIIIAGQDIDTVFGEGADDDIIGGHNVPDGQDTGDNLDGGTGVDVITGDNAAVLRTGASFDPRFQTLTGSTIFDTNGNALISNIDRANPTGALERFIRPLNHTFTTDPSYFGNDYIAGGPGDDRIFGELGNDTIQGDANILSRYLGAVSVSAFSDPTTGLL